MPAAVREGAVVHLLRTILVVCLMIGVLSFNEPPITD